MYAASRSLNKKSAVVRSADGEHAIPIAGVIPVLVAVVEALDPPVGRVVGGLR
jgi:hypothetical protein